MNKNLDLLIQSLIVETIVQHIILLLPLKYTILFSSHGRLNMPKLKCTIYVV